MYNTRSGLQEVEKSELGEKLLHEYIGNYIY